MIRRIHVGIYFTGLLFSLISWIWFLVALRPFTTGVEEGSIIMTGLALIPTSYFGSLLVVLSFERKEEKAQYLRSTIVILLMYKFYLYLTYRLVLADQSGSIVEPGFFGIVLGLIYLGGSIVSLLMISLSIYSWMLKTYKDVMDRFGFLGLKHKNLYLYIAIFFAVLFSIMIWMKNVDNLVISVTMAVLFVGASIPDLLIKIRSDTRLDSTNGI